MKVGDLVELSAAGEASKYYGTFTGYLGIVLGIHHGEWRVCWYNKPGWKNVHVGRRYLKHVKAPKK